MKSQFNNYKKQSLTDGNHFPYEATKAQKQTKEGKNWEGIGKVIQEIAYDDWTNGN